MRRYIVRLPIGSRGEAYEPGFPVRGTSLREVQRRYPRAKIWRATEDRLRLPPWLPRAGQLIRRGGARVWHWTRSRDARPW
jgi:hypothetical protein